VGLGFEIRVNELGNEKVMLKTGDSSEWKELNNYPRTTLNAHRATMANLGRFLHFELYFSFSLFCIQLFAVSLIELLTYSVDQ